MLAPSFRRGFQSVATWSLKMWKFFTLFLLAFSPSVYAELPFNPNIQDGQSSYTEENGHTQYHKPSYKREGDSVYEVRDGRTQYHQPSYKIEGDKMYEVKDGRTQYHRPSYRIE